VVRILSALLTWAVAEGQLERNPLRGGALALGSDGVRETVITDPADYARLFTTLDRLVAENRMRPVVRVFLIIAALTGMRRSELQTLAWGQVDLRERRITLIDTKGAKLARQGARSETVSLPPFAATALSAIMPVELHDPAALVFPPSRGRRLQVHTGWVLARREAGLPATLTLHGLRHSLGTAAVLSGLSAPEVQALLRHRTLSTTGRYLHLAEVLTSRLQDRVAARLIGEASDADIHILWPRRRA
jgi:integrase